MKIIRHNGGKRHPIHLQDYMERFFEDPFMADPFGFLDMGLVPTKRGMCLPKIDLSEDSKELKIVADIPGYKPEDIEIEMRENSIVLKGKMKDEKMEEDEHFFRRERSVGEFYREIPFPENVNLDQAEGKIKNGTLTIHLPKADKQSKRTLKIQVED